jgi:hypothetical protein
MPKKKSKSRKKGKKAKKKVALKPVNQTAAKGEAAAKKKKAGFIARKLYSNDSEGLYRLVSIAPFFVGSWIAGGLFIGQMFPFVALTIALMISQFVPELERNKKVIFAREFKLIAAAAIVAVMIWYFSMTNNVGTTALFALAIIIEQLSNQIDFSTARNVLQKSISLVVKMSIFSVVAITTQTIALNPQIEWQYAVFGFVPGMVLASSWICKYSQVFLNEGWTRFHEKTKKDGRVVRRPAGLSRVFSMFIVLGPAVPTICVPFDLFPTPFLSCALAFYPIPKLLDKFLNETEQDSFIAFNTANLALGLTGLMLVIGILVRNGIV